MLVRPSCRWICLIGCLATLLVANPAARNSFQVASAVLAQEPDVSNETPEPAKPEPKGVENPFPRRFPAPSLDGGTGWLNTSAPITNKDLRGKIVLLDFWTFCCINCMHVLPDLAELEEKYSNEVVVIGVHSAKFDNEKDTENIRQAILRYEISHPVINDSNMTVWRKFSVNVWPTLVLIDPEGYYCGFVTGEGNKELLDTVIGKLIDYHRAKGTLDETPIKLDLERGKVEDTPLRYPGKILADEASNRLFISDSNHNRIVITDLAGTVQEVIGSGAIGQKNGSFTEAEFDHPQGMDLHGDTLYVADTENHLLRAVDLKQKTVTTIAGVGEQAHERGNGGKPSRTALASPWDVKYIDGKLYIAMAGPHQIWVLDFKDDRIKPYAGSGREDIRDGSLTASALAQPSGIATDGKFLYVVDSEGSAVRKIPLSPRGEVSTIVGTYDLPNGRSLFEFGDRDGNADNVRLQHPLGIAYHEGVLFVADSYNHKIKRVEIDKRHATTFAGTGQKGNSDKPAQFSEPAGLAIAGENLYVADTNNHLIRVIDLLTKEVRTLELKGLTPPVVPTRTEEVAGAAATEVPAVQIAAQGAAEFSVQLALPEGYKLNSLAPVTYRWQADKQDLISADQLGSRQTAEVQDNTARFKLQAGDKAGDATLRLTVSYSYCRDGKGGLCRFKSAHWVVPVKVGSAGATEPVQLKVELEDAGK